MSAQSDGRPAQFGLSAGRRAGRLPASRRATVSRLRRRRLTGRRSCEARPPETQARCAASTATRTVIGIAAYPAFSRMCCRRRRYSAPDGRSMGVRALRRAATAGTAAAGGVRGTPRARTIEIVRVNRQRGTSSTASVPARGLESEGEATDRGDSCAVRDGELDRFPRGQLEGSHRTSPICRARSLDRRPGRRIPSREIRSNPSRSFGRGQAPAAAGRRPDEHDLILGSASLSSSVAPSCRPTTRVSTSSARTRSSAPAEVVSGK